VVTVAVNPVTPQSPGPAGSVNGDTIILARNPGPQFAAGHFFQSETEYEVQDLGPGLTWHHDDPARPSD
jgi:hypothetical protein